MNYAGLLSLIGLIISVFRWVTFGIYFFSLAFNRNWCSHSWACSTIERLLLRRRRLKKDSLWKHLFRAAEQVRSLLGWRPRTVILRREQRWRRHLFCTGLNPERILGRPTTRESTEDTLGMVSMKPLVGQHARHVLFDPSILFHMGVTHALLPIFSRRCEKSGSWLSRCQ